MLNTKSWEVAWSGANNSLVRPRWLSRGIVRYALKRPRFFGEIGSEASVIGTGCDLSISQEENHVSPMDLIYGYLILFQQF